MSHKMKLWERVTERKLRLESNILENQINESTIEDIHIQTIDGEM